MELVSIIMPLFNSERFLKNSIDSIVNQNYKKWELIVIDDCSTDASVTITKAYSEVDSRIKLIQLDKNSGAAVARNTGISLASGKYIAFLDSDDLWSPSKLKEQVEFMEKNNVYFSYTAYKKIDEDGKEIISFGVPLQLTYNELLKSCVIGCLTVIYDAKKLGKIHMPLGTKREDYALWLKILREKNLIAYGLNKNLAFYRVYQGQSSSKKLNMAKENWYLLRNQENLSLIFSMYFFIHYAIRSSIRNKFPILARKLKFLALSDD